ncbi:hypothetical protein ABB22_04620 [Stenotrophomonas nitritireducens]|uniref:Uncharacterized protein n=1 Tax=Stenotrophomonas nitritireducens TaxID=83617 RepID=A0ABR5NML9_9GAMM|nr:hypothetical protein ABB22_04620 [Stenotrophomonas nitritireducens]
MIRRATALLLLLGLAARLWQPSRAMPVIVQVQAGRREPARHRDLHGRQRRHRLPGAGAMPPLRRRPGGRVPRRRWFRAGRPGQALRRREYGRPRERGGPAAHSAGTGSTSAGDQPCAPCR